MQVVSDPRAWPRRGPAVVALGNFDGVHRGHRAILETALDQGRKRGNPTLVLTFEPQPARVLAPQHAPRLLLTPQDKLDLLAASGIDCVVALPFTLELSRLSPRQFVETYLVKQLGVSCVVVGYSVSFGHKRAGNAPVMEELARELGFDSVTVGPVKFEGREVSSSTIRNAIESGDMETATRMLGRYHFLRGTVVHGRHRGREIGFPTANLLSATECIPPDGVYASRADLPKGPMPAITNIGVRPTFGEAGRSIETHIFDFDGDLYGQEIKLEIVERIRPERKFESKEALSRQIAIDLRRAREILAGA